MYSMDKTIETLNRILGVEKSMRKEIIMLLQNEIWNGEVIADKTLSEILQELAYDLDFYEPNKGWKEEDPSYYGNKRLEEIIKIGILKLENHKKALAE